MVPAEVKKQAMSISEEDAIAALASNFFLGQGVYTPWQMLAWGGCGVLAGLARGELFPGQARQSYTFSSNKW